MAASCDLPLLTALATAANRDRAAFYAPGHKGGQGVSTHLRSLLGTLALQADLSELPELDNLFAPTGPIQAAQALAAQTFGADETFFLANGSTGGIEAAMLATCGPTDKVLVPRNAHRSVLAALVLTGAQPIYLAPEHHPDWDLAFGVTAESVRQAFLAHPDLRAVVVVSPSYHGVCADIAAIAATVHHHDAVLIVDEAHGAHLEFHTEFPPSAIASGADIAIQSTHKTLSALSQASMLHVQGDRANRDRLRQALQLTQSTSPNYLLLASLDAARHQMATQGTALMAQTLALATQVRQRLTAVAPLRLLEQQHLESPTGAFWIDPTRVVVDVAPLGPSGFAADEFLHERLGVTAELPTLRQLAFIWTLGNTALDGDRLVTALEQWVGQTTSPQNTAPNVMTVLPPLLSQPTVTPRAAFFAPTRAVPYAEAIGSIAADPICPYPPGIPVVLPGEVISAEAIATLQQVQAGGGIVTGTVGDRADRLRVMQ